MTDGRAGDDHKTESTPTNDGVLSRRQFIGATVALPLIGAASALGAGVETTDWDLDLALSDDERLLVVGIIERVLEPGAVAGEVVERLQKATETWRIDARWFGPEARFVVTSRNVPGANGRSYVLDVRQVRYGHDDPGLAAKRFMSFEFHLDRPRDSQSVALRWHLRASTDVWSEGPKSSRSTFGLDTGNGSVRSVDLRAFIAGSQKLRKRLARDRVNDPLARMFNGLVTARRRAVVEFDADGAWTLSTPDSLEPVFLGIHPKIAGSTLNLRWVVVEDANLREDHPITDGRIGKTVAPDAPLRALASGGRTGSGVVGILELESTTGPLTFGGVRQRIALTQNFGPNEQGVHSPRLVLTTPERAVGEAPQSFAAVEGTWSVLAQTPEGVTGQLEHLVGRLRATATVVGRLASHPRSVETTYTFDADFSTDKPQALRSPVGPLVVSGVPPAERSTAGEASDGGPFRNMSGSAVRFSLVQSPGQSPATAVLHWFEATVHLVEASFALEGAAYSRLSFDRAELLFLFALKEAPTLPRGSFVRLGPVPAGALAARFDLGLARLRAARWKELLSLRFRFQGMALEVIKASDRTAPARLEIVNATQTCGVLADSVPAVINNESDAEYSSERDGSKARDFRPVLVVEFPPQHMLEEAKFIPNPPPLPDVAINPRTTSEKLVFFKGSRGGSEWDFEFLELPAGEKTYLDDDRFLINPDIAEEVLGQLARLDLAGRAKFRRRLMQRKRRAAEAGGGTGYRLFSWIFQVRASRYATGALSRHLPLDQQYYIGPIALAPDAHMLARDVQTRQARRHLERQVEKVFAEAARQAGALFATQAFDFAAWSSDFSARLRLESRLEASVPSYADFRSFYRERRLEELLKTHAGARAESIEFVLGLEQSSVGTVVARERTAVEEKEIADFVTNAFGADPAEGLVEGRWSEPSRLAFHVSCRDGLTEARATATGLDRIEDEGLSPGRLGFHYTLDDLTNWSSLELSVVRRAQRVYAPGRGGRLDPDSDRIIDLSVAGRLKQLGFASGDFVTAATRMSDIAKSMAEPPGLWETSVVIPARLSLSPSNEGVFLSRREVPSAIFPDAAAGSSGSFIHSGPRDTDVLWSARLAVDGLDPQVRAVHSPDFRPGFAFSPLSQLDGEAMNRTIFDPEIGSAGEIVRLPGSGAPPPGNIAPWLIGQDETVAGSPSARIIAQHIDGSHLDPRPLDALASILANPALTDQDFAEAAKGSTLLPRLIPFLARRAQARELLRSRRKFRAALSANDRHQLVVLTSAYGLPVMLSNEVPASGGGSALRPDDGNEVVDLMPGVGIYNPRPLALTELELTALGGSLRHSTNFEPPVSPRHISGRGLYDALSIERWQQWTVLGRDVLSEVVYKGYLFPIGHRASLVKVTQRTFLRDSATKLIRAYLVQRMFIRVSTPEKKFSAVLQPADGRRFPVRSARLITEVTPDIVDPYNSEAPAGTPAGQVLSSGRIVLGQRPGLAFWPRTTLLSGSEIRFEMALDDVVSSLPLIFVDNVAANDDGALETLVNYYNTQIPSPDTGGVQPAEAAELVTVEPSSHLRTVRLGGQSMRYAPEVKAGSASFETESWTLGVEGRQRRRPAVVAGVSSAGEPAADSVTFDNTAYGPLPILQSADQPSFYPMVETARIRLRQNERLTGSRAEPVRVRFDGSYVEKGLPLPQGGAPKEGYEEDLANQSRLAGNGAQIVLTVLDQPLQSMGSKGDQSGGLIRPAGRIVALSRAKGPITSVELLQPADGAPNFSVAATHTSMPREQKDRSDLIEEIRKLEGLRSAEHIYKSVLGRYMLFGVVNVGEVAEKAIEALKSPEVGGPTLNQLEQRGLGGVGGLENIDEVVARARESVLKPLSLAIKAIRDGWHTLDDELQQSQEAFGAGAVAITISDLFPDLDRALDSLDAALDVAIAETSDVVALTRLADVYEAGQRLFDAIDAIASNPAEVFDGAVKRKYGTLASFVRDTEGRLADVLSAVAETIGKIPARVIAQIAEVLVPKRDLGAGATHDYAWPYLPLPVPLFRHFPEARQSLLLRAETVYSIVAQLLKELLTGQTPLAKLLDPEREFDRGLFSEPSTIIGFLQQAVTDRIGPTDTLIRRSVTGMALDETLAELESYRALVTDAPEWLNSVLQDEVAYINRWLAAIEGLRSAISQRDVRGTAKQVVALLDLVGASFDIEAFCENVGVNSAFVSATRALGTVATFVDEASGARLIDQLSVDAGMARDAVSAAAAKLWELPFKKLREDIDKGPDELEKLKKQAHSAVDGTEHVAANMGEAANILTELVSKLSGEQQRLEALEAVIADAVTKAEASKLCGLDGTLPTFERLPKLLGPLLERRTLLMQQIYASASAIVRILDELAGDSDVKWAVTLAATGAVLDEMADKFSPEIRALAERVQSHEEAVSKQALELLRSLSTWLAPLITRMADGAKKLVRDIAAVASDFRALAVALDVADLEANANTLALVADEINQAKVVIDAAIASGRFSFEALQAIRLPAADRSLLRLYRIDTDLDGARLFLVKQVEDKITELAKVMRDAFNVRVVEARENALKTVDQLALEILSAKVEAVGLAGDAVGMPRSHGLLHAIYAKLFDLRAEALANVSPALEPSLRNILFIPIELSYGVEPPPDDRLQQDRDMLAMAVTTAAPISDVNNRSFLRDFFAAWADGLSTPQLILRNVVDKAADLIRGDFLQLIDLKAIRAACEDYILSLVPTSLKLEFRAGAPLPPSVAEVTNGLFAPQEGCRFDVVMTASIDLAAENARLQMRSVGTLGPFHIKLVGDYFDAVTLKFAGAEFITEQGAKPSFKVHFEDFEIGPELEFVQEFAPFFPTGGAGFNIRPSLSPIGIEARYLLPAGTITIGTLSIFNLSVEASALLPFSDEDARFRGALSKRLAPFTISAAPYGGSGFFSIEANAKGITGFEASFEYGGAGAFAFGPLTGQGRLMAGIYIRQRTLPSIGKVTEISGTFFAGGSANIWIFSFGASLHVRLGMVNGNMTGEAVFTYSFSMGLKDFDFSVTVWKKEEKGFNSPRQGSIPARTRFASIGESEQGNGPPPPGTPLVRSVVWHQDGEWSDYIRYFDRRLEAEVDEGAFR